MEKLEIMVVEDERDHFDLMKYAIRNEFPNSVVCLCENVELCRKRLEETIPDILIVDYLLPGATGLEFCEELRKRKVDIPFIVVTGHGDESIAVKAMKLDVFDYVVKSGNFFEFIPKIIRKALHDRELKVRVRQVEDNNKRLHAQLQQARKMEAIGTLTGGIAHDFNNLLMGIQGRTSLMLIDIDPSHPHYRYLKETEELVRSAADLTKQLLGFARGGKYEAKPTDMNQLIQESSEMFGRLRKEVVIRRKREENLWTVEVDWGQIEQVLLNLYVNAWQAMPKGGEIYLRTKNVTIDQSFSRPFAVKPGPYVRISVTDNGEGMDEAILERIFEPFFTTREMGRGTGLGLATAYGIVKSHGGFIDVYSEKGEGTTFEIYLPATGAEHKIKMQNPERNDRDEMPRGAETVLLVDDEDMIMDIGEQILRELGYKVFVARSGQEAIERLKGNRDVIDMVILDMIMPGMSGVDTYDRLKEIRPDIKVLLSSGYGISSQIAAILKRGCDSFIQKPFSMKDLSQKLREVWDKI